MKVALFAIFLLLPWLLWAAPMTVDADRFELEQDENRADFFGHVIVLRDDMRLKADKVRVWYEKIESGKQVLDKVLALGHVDIQTPENTGASEQAEFTTKSDVLILTGNAHMQSKQGKISGEVIRYNIKTKDTKVVKGSSNEQVRFTFEEALPNE